MAKIVIFTGAGISAESGINTFRDSDGLWEQHRIEDVCTKGCLETNREATVSFYDARRLDLETKKPNKAHYEVAKLKEKYPDKIAIITQNVDNLFEKAGCDDVIHVHGFLTQIKCQSCEYIEDIGCTKQDDAWENCPMCKSGLRPNVVFFGERAPYYEDMFKEIDDCEYLVVIGTSGAVLCVDLMIGKEMKHTVLNNLEPSSSLNHKKFKKVLFKPATQAIDEIVQDIEKFLKDQL